MAEEYLIKNGTKKNERADAAMDIFLGDFPYLVVKRVPFEGYGAPRGFDELYEDELQAIGNACWTIIKKLRGKKYLENITRTIIKNDAKTN